MEAWSTARTVSVSRTCRACRADRLPKSDGYCVYSPAFGQFVYRPALVNRMVDALQTAEQYRDEIGKEAQTREVAAE